MDPLLKAGGRQPDHIPSTTQILRRLGASEAELLRSYPGLRAEDLANAWAYVRTHRDQIDAQIQDNEAA